MTKLRFLHYAYAPVEMTYSGIYGKYTNIVISTEAERSNQYKNKKHTGQIIIRPFSYPRIIMDAFWEKINTDFTKFSNFWIKFADCNIAK